jgi:uncharacterized membrane protein YczE
VPRRLVQLLTGLVLYGISDSMLLLAGLGVDPWDVLHQGLARRTGVPTGTWAIIVGAAVLLLWIPLRQATVLLAGWLLGGTVGVGTVIYAVCIGPLAHVFVPLFSRPKPGKAAKTATSTSP